MLPSGNMITMKRFDEATPVRVARAFGYPGPVLGEYSWTVHRHSGECL
jgi:hypothetical protein